MTVYRGICEACMTLVVVGIISNFKMTKALTLNISSARMSTCQVVAYQRREILCQFCAVILHLLTETFVKHL